MKQLPKYTRNQYAKTQRVCIVCTNSFEGTQRAKFCSNACKQKDKYQRSKTKKA